jgi:hypothetical protein
MLPLPSGRAQGEGTYSGSGRSSVLWHWVHTQVRMGVGWLRSRRRVQGMSPMAPQRGHRSAFCPGCNWKGSHGILDFMRVIVA